MTDKSESSLLAPADLADKRLPDTQRDGLESAPDATLLVRADGAIADLNQQVESLFGYSRQELIDKNFALLIPERFRERHADHVAGYFHNPQGRRMGSGLELWGLRKDGSEFPADIALNSSWTPDGLYIVCSIRDQSDRWRLQDALKKQLSFERLVADISARFANLRLEDVDTEITRSLQQIVEFMEVDRTGFCEFSDDQNTLTSTHFYAVPGVAPTPPWILSTQFPWYTAHLRGGGIHRIASLPDDLPPEAEAEREYVIAVGMKAHLSIPIKIGGWVRYVFPMDSFRSTRHWPDKVVQRLQLLGEIFAGALMRKRAQEALQESEAKFRLLAETATCGIAIYQGDRFRYVSPRTMEITGYSADELLSMSVDKLVHPDFRALVRERAQARLRGETAPARYELKIITKQGEERWVDFSASMTYYQGQPAIIGTAFDVSKRKRAEESLIELSGRLIQGQEEERTRLARELHDDFSQRLALLSIKLEEVGRQLAPPAPASGKQLQDLWQQTRDIGTDLHRLSHQLHPSQLEALGLVPAVRSFCADLAKQKRLHIEFECQGIPQEPAPEVALCLYRIAQEGLQNVSKHSGTSRARVTLTGGHETLDLTVTDDGIGFDPDSLGTSPGLGLVSMRERVRLVHGEFSLQSQPGRGTRLEARIPLHRASA